MFKIQALIKSIIRVVYLKTLQQSLEIKPLELCLPSPLVLKVVTSFYGKIKTIAITLLPA